MSYCRNCGSDMSENATYCPVCGEPTGNKQTKARWPTAWFGFLMVITAVIPLVGWISGGIACYRGHTAQGGWLVGFGLVMALIYMGTM